MVELEIWVVFNLLNMNKNDDFATLTGAFRRPTITTSTTYATTFVIILATITKISAA